MTEVGPPRQAPGSAAAVRQRPEPCAERICRTRRRPPRDRRSSPPTPTDRPVACALRTTSRRDGHPDRPLGNCAAMAGMTTEQAMTTEHIHFGDSTRQAALFETMILAAAADGSVDKVELQEIYRRVFERPEFHGIQADDLRLAIEHAARRVAEAHSLEHILPSIVDRLPDKASRELAFGLAASVIVADGRTPLAELNILKALQDMFDLSEEDVARLFETAQSHGEFPPTKGK
ncbi:MAG: hypothetical protein E6J63_14760 [Deltaproteobacteria bacterium]|nr:MAG: hypothetical protein E6J63_14760 [Deltaproteobacteria bacterium]